MISFAALCTVLFYEMSKEEEEIQILIPQCQEDITEMMPYVSVLSSRFEWVSLRV